MIDFILAFLTGLTAGSLSCLAVQGGLLASSIAQQAEKDFQPQTYAQQTQKKQTAQAQPSNIAARPILTFLGAKLIAYTALGFLLGWLGSMIQLTPTLRAILLLAVGVFMVGNALRMFDVHPVFRYFVIEPPSFITRYIRRRAKQGGDDLIAPAFLGALTVLIPCGVTQAIMAVALSTGSALQGAALMFAFILGTSPLFFALAYLARRLGNKMHERFIGAVATVVLALGILSIDSGLTLADSPITLATFTEGGSAFTLGRSAQVNTAPTPRPSSASAPNSSAPSFDNTATVTVLPNAYSPNYIKAKANQPFRLLLKTDDSYG